jgi:plasmid stabilization system protein ParE
MTEAATSDVDHIVTLIPGQNPSAARRLARRLLEAAITLERHPSRGRVVPELERIDVTDVRELVY